MRHDPNPTNFREYAGVLAAFIVVMAFVAIGFVQFAVTLFQSKVIPVPGDWMAAMLSLASAALGYLIGKQSNATTQPPVVNPPPDAPQ